MYSLRNKNTDFILRIYQDSRTVFRLNMIAMLTGESDFSSLNQKVNYYVQTGKLLNPRKGIYAKPNYSIEELASVIYSPSYISLEYVLQKAGIIFQYDSRLTIISYLRRDIHLGNRTFSYRKIKDDILLNDEGIISKDNINIASPERAFLDLLYLDKSYYFDNTDSLDKTKVYKLLQIYNSKAMNKRISNYFPYA